MTSHINFYHSNIGHETKFISFGCFRILVSRIGITIHYFKDDLQVYLPLPRMCPTSSWQSKNLFRLRFRSQRLELRGPARRACNQAHCKYRENKIGTIRVMRLLRFQRLNITPRCSSPLIVLIITIYRSFNPVGLTAREKFGQQLKILHNSTTNNSIILFFGMKDNFR